MVKVRGNAGERRSWPSKNCWRTFSGPIQALVVQTGCEGPLQLTVEPQIFFSELLGPKFILQPLGTRRWRSVQTYFKSQTTKHCLLDSPPITGCESNFYSQTSVAAIYSGAWFIGAAGFVKAKFHYAIWWSQTSSKLVADLQRAEIWPVI